MANSPFCLFTIFGIQKWFSFFHFFCISFLFFSFFELIFDRKGDRVGLVLETQLQAWLHRQVAGFKICCRRRCNRFNGLIVSSGNSVHNKGNYNQLINFEQQENFLIKTHFSLSIMYDYGCVIWGCEIFCYSFLDVYDGPGS